MALDQTSHTHQTLQFLWSRSGVRLTALNQEDSQASKLSLLGYAVISHSDPGYCGPFSGLQLIISSAVLESPELKSSVNRGEGEHRS